MSISQKHRVHSAKVSKQKIDKEKFGLYQGQVQSYTQFAGTMAAVVLFFTGLILTKFDSYDLSIRVPIALLIISIFGFLYGALIYTNAAQEVANYNEKGFLKAIFLGDIISEYLGVYLLVITIPLIINVIAADLFLRIVTLLSSLIGLGIYQFSHFSIIERHFKRAHSFIAILTLGFGLCLFFAQLFQIYFVEVSLLFGIFILIVTFTAAQRFR